MLLLFKDCRKLSQESEVYVPIYMLTMLSSKLQAIRLLILSTYTSVFGLLTFLPTARRRLLKTFSNNFWYNPNY